MTAIHLHKPAVKRLLPQISDTGEHSKKDLFLVNLLQFDSKTDGSFQELNVTGSGQVKMFLVWQKRRINVA